MSPDPERFCDLVCSGRYASFKEEKWEEAFERREEPVFETPWLRVREFLDARLIEAPLSPELKGKVLVAREAAFMNAFKNHQSAELAAFVSDDIELLAHALAVECEDEWLRALAAAYGTGRFPFRPLKPMAGKLVELLALNKG